MDLQWQSSCSVQGNPDAAADDTDDDDATTDESNPYMSPFQATQKGMQEQHTKQIGEYGHSNNDKEMKTKG